MGEPLGGYDLEGAQREAEYLQEELKLDIKQQFHVVYLNDNHYAISGEDIIAADRKDCEIKASTKHPYGLPCGLVTIYTKKAWDEFRAQKDKEQEEYAEKVRHENAR